MKLAVRRSVMQHTQAPMRYLTSIAFVSMFLDRAHSKSAAQASSNIRDLLNFLTMKRMKSRSKIVISPLQIKRTLQREGFYGTIVLDMTVEDSSVCVLRKRTSLFHKSLHQCIPRMKKEMRAFLSSTSGAAWLVYHSTFDYLSSNQDPDSLQYRKVGALFLFQIPHQLCADISFR